MQYNAVQYYTLNTMSAKQYHTKTIQYSTIIFFEKKIQLQLHIPFNAIKSVTKQ